MKAGLRCIVCCFCLVTVSSTGCDSSESSERNNLPAASQGNPQATKALAMQDKIEVEDKWDFYPCRVEDHPGSMNLNMSYINHAPIEGAGTVYWIDFEMPDPGEHGMGNDASFDLLRIIDDHVVESLEKQPLYYVGRLRNAGLWTMYFFGPEGLDSTIESAARLAIKDNDQTPFANGSKPDPGWSVYTDFIYPSPERHRWMRDRSVVDVLLDNGDQHDQPRRVDHWMYFSSKAERDEVAKACEIEDFSIENRPDDNTGGKAFGLQVYRDDPTELSHINSVTSMLTEMAANHNGEYDGWETFIIRADEAKEQ
jgi:regulator of RNase E activity RraB